MTILQASEEISSQNGIGLEKQKDLAQHARGLVEKPPSPFPWLVFAKEHPMKTCQTTAAILNRQAETTPRIARPTEANLTNLVADDDQDDAFFLARAFKKMGSAATAHFVQDGQEPVTIAIGNQERVVNELYQVAIRAAHPGISFHFETAAHVGVFIALASKPETHLALFKPPGNLIPDPDDAEATPEQVAIRVVRAIKARHSVPIIVIAVQHHAREALLAAGADVFLDFPARPQEIGDAVARCLGLSRGNRANYDSSPGTARPLPH